MKHHFYIRAYNASEHKGERLKYNIPHYTFLYLTEGEMLLYAEGKNILVSPGQFLLLHPGMKVTAIHLSSGCGFEGYFDLEFLKDASYQVLRQENSVLQSFWFDDAVFFGALLKRSLSAYEDGDTAFLQSAMDLVLCQLRSSGKIAAIPEKFLKLVFEEGKSPHPVAYYASILKVTPNYLNKSVKNHTHRTAIDWIEIARVNIAKQLLRDVEMPVADIAEAVGLDDQSYFSRFFKKRTGLTPSEFRKTL